MFYSSSESASREELVGLVLDKPLILSLSKDSNGNCFNLVIGSSDHLGNSALEKPAFLSFEPVWRVEKFLSEVIHPRGVKAHPGGESGDPGGGLSRMLFFSFQFSLLSCSFDF